MNKFLCLAALAGLICAVPAAAVMDLEAPTPAQILAEAHKKAYALPAAPHEVFVEPVRASSGRWQAIARPRNLSPRGPHVPVWTHQCYATPGLAEAAAISACERENLGWTCTASAYQADRCDR